MFDMGFLLKILLCFVCIGYSASLESYELDLYDLVEEVNGTFYEFLGVSPDCNLSDIRKAYRRLSLVLHPDKNNHPDAEIQFRQLVGIYDILKNEETRNKYNEVLVNGLPTWRQPLYYYRKVRKFGFLESAVVLLVTVSVIHYAVIWAAFWEKKFEIEEVYQSRLKKNTKRKNNIEKNDELMAEMIEAKNSIKRPGFSDLLLCQFLLSCKELAFKLPENIIHIKEIISQRMSTPVDTSESNETEDERIKENRKKKRADDIFSNISPPEMASDVQPVIYQDINKGPTSEKLDAESPKDKDEKKAHWTELDYSNLAKAMQKFPQGTTLRWEKIAQQLNQTPAEVLNRAKKIKEGLAVTKDDKSTFNLDMKKKKSEVVANGGISVRELVTPDEGSDAAKGSEWSQVQQKALEEALTIVPKTVADRWDEISKHVPGKTKADCIARYKYLAEIVKQKRQAASSQVS